MYKGILKITVMTCLLASVTSCSSPQIRSIAGSAVAGALIGSATDSDTALKAAAVGAVAGSQLSGLSGLLSSGIF